MAKSLARTHTHSNSWAAMSALIPVPYYLQTQVCVVDNIVRTLVRLLLFRYTSPVPASHEYVKNVAIAI